MLGRVKPRTAVWGHGRVRFYPTAGRSALFTYGRSPPPHGPLQMTLIIGLFQASRLSCSFASPAQPHQDLGDPAVVEVQLQRHQGESFFVSLTRELPQFLSVDQQFAGSLGFVIPQRGLRVLGNIAAHQPELAVPGPGRTLPPAISCRRGGSSLRSPPGRCRTRAIPALRNGAVPCGSRRWAVPWSACRSLHPSCWLCHLLPCSRHPVGFPGKRSARSACRRAHPGSHHPCRIRGVSTLRGLSTPCLTGSEPIEITALPRHSVTAYSVTVSHEARKGKRERPAGAAATVGGSSDARRLLLEWTSRQRPVSRSQETVRMPDSAFSPNGSAADNGPPCAIQFHLLGSVPFDDAQHLQRHLSL